VAALAAAVAVVPLSAGGAETSASSEETTLVVGIAGDPATLDPGIAAETIANTIIKNTYFQWTKYGVGEGAGGYTVSDVATILPEAASYEMSEDNLTATFTVTEGAVFPSGNPITSDDFVYTVQRALETNTGPVFIFNTLGITDISQVEKVSDTQFTITLPAPSPMFGPLLRDQDASVLDSVAIGEHATDDDPWATEWMAQNSVGGGAYTLASYEPGNQVVLTKNPEYPGAADVYYETVILRIIPSETDRAQLLADGTLDVAESLGVDAIASLSDTEGVSVLNVPTRSQNFLGLVRTFEPFADVRVRQAIAHAIDYDSLANNLAQGYASVPVSLWPQNSASFDAELTNSPLTTDLDAARALLEEAGYGDGLEFTIEVSTADATGQALAVAVQSALSEIGVTVSIEQVAPATFSEHLFAKSANAFIRTGVLSYIDDPYYSLFLFYTSDAVLNWWGMDNAELDGISDQLATELDPAARQELASQAQQILNDEIPAVILTEPNYLLGIRDDVAGFVLEPDNLVRYSLLGPAE
jgi:peptide/nickel transport system substrate-binding protein